MPLCSNLSKESFDFAVLWITQGSRRKNWLVPLCNVFFKNSSDFEGVDGTGIVVLELPGTLVL